MQRSNAWGAGPIRRLLRLGLRLSLASLAVVCSVLDGRPAHANETRIEREAEDFQRGNVRVDREHYGRDIGVVRAGDRTPCLVQYDFDIDEPGRYELSLRYAAGSSCPVELAINGRVVHRQLCAEPTGSWLPEGQQWVSAGAIELTAGRNTLRLTSAWTFPHLDKLVLAREFEPPAGAPDNAPHPPHESGPWKITGEPRPFAETCYEDFRSDPRGGLDRASASQWLEPLAGRSVRLVELTGSEAPGVRFSGFARLRSPWPQGAVLRTSLDARQVVKLHFWNGRQGVSLYHYPQAHRAWAAYRTTRRPGSSLVIGNQAHVLPDAGFALLATDNGRCRRLQSPTYEFRHQDGALVVTQGDVVLLTAPLDDPPTEICLEGSEVVLRDLALYRGEPAPLESEASGPVVLHGDHPSSLPWQTRLPEGASFERLVEGPVRLSAERAASTATAFVRLPRSGLYELTVCLESPTAGTALYLGDGRGEPLLELELFRDEATGRAWLGPAADSGVPTQPPNADQAPALFLGERQWLRLVVGPGLVKCWISGDGRSWSRALALPRPAAVSWGSVGLAVKAASRRRAIELSRLELRELSMLAGLAPVELQEQAELAGIETLVAQVRDLGVWQQRVWQLQPPGVDAADWRDACAVVTLQGTATPELAQALRWAIVDHHVLGAEATAELLSDPQTLEHRLRLLDALLLLEKELDEPQARRLAAVYQHLGQVLMRGGQPQAVESVRRAMMTSPAWSDAWPADYGPHKLVHAQLVQLAQQPATGNARELIARLRDWGRGEPAQPDGRSLADLIAFTSLQSGLGRPAEGHVEESAVQADWRHPLEVELEKEAFNTLAELQVALSDRSYEDACQIIASAAASRTVGLLPDGKDPRLLGSLQALVAAAMHDHPGLRRMMNDQFAPIGALRVQQAIRDADADALQSATLQYHGTHAAAEAHRWLGDRAHSAGWFAQALARYRQALTLASPNQQAALQARIRLANAMLGQREGEPIREPIDLGGRSLSPEQFERLVDQMLARSPSSAADCSAERPSIRPRRFAAQPWARFDGELGTSAGDLRHVDWAGRQMAAYVHGDVLIVSNRFQIVAYVLETGSLRWGYSLKDRQGAAHAWPLVPMRPQVNAAAGRVYARVLADSGPEMVCLALDDGAPLWTMKTGDALISDPLLLQDRLYALALRQPPDQRTAQLLLLEIDEQTGAVRGETPLVGLHKNWSLHGVCQVSAADDRLVAAVGGSLLCCDAEGRVLWVRRSGWLPPKLHPEWQRQYHQPPLIAEGRIYTCQPGVPGVECVDLETGRLHWSALPRGVERILCISGERLLVQTAEAIEALSLRTGQALWQHPASDLLVGVHAPAEAETLLVVQREPAGTGRWCPVLRWIDSVSGREVAASALPELAGALPQIGPLLACRGRVWCFAGTADSDGRPLARREILELVAGENGLPDVQPASWTSAAPQQTAAAAVLPGWTLLSTQQDEQTGLRGAGEARVLVTKAGGSPAALARRMTLPEGKPRLALQAAALPEGAAKVEVRVAGALLAQLTPAPPPEGDWATVEIDLAAYAGQTVWLTLSHDHQGQGPSHVHWRRADVVP